VTDIGDSKLGSGACISRHHSLISNSRLLDSAASKMAQDEVSLYLVVLGENV
jgi:hypothetical protein